MPVLVSLLRAVNLGGRNRIKMVALRDVYRDLQLRDAQTYVQSGNVVFRTNTRDLLKLAGRIESAIAESFGFQSSVILRTTAELREVIARNPFANRRDVKPDRLAVVFLAGDPGHKAREQIREMKIEPEELRIADRELYIYFPNGMGRSKLSVPRLEKALGTSGTARNWNSVLKLLEMAETLEAGVEC